MRNMEAAAVIVYGALALVLAFALAVVQGAFWGAAAIVVATGFTYVYQFTQFLAGDTADGVLNALQSIVVGLFVLSLVLSTLGV